MRARIAIIAALAVALVTAFFVHLPAPAVAQDDLPNGPWVNELVWSEQTDAGLALEQIKSGEADFFMFTLQGGTQKVDAFTSPDVLTFDTYGSVNGLLFNPDNQVGDGAAGQNPMNPFTNQSIREAMNWLIDRELLNLELLDGFADQFVVPFHPQEADYFRELDLFTELEAEYQADFARAEQVISDALTGLGATMNAEGWWEDQFGEELLVKIINRVEDERLEIGNYVHDQLEAVGIKAETVPSPSSTAISTVYGGPSDQGIWHVYTEGWAFTANVAWDDAQILVFHACFGLVETFCTPDGTFEVSDELFDKSLDLAFGAYGSLEERQQLIRDTVPLALTEGSYRMWIQAEQAVFPVSTRVESTVMDAFGGPWTYFTLKTAKLLPGEEGVNPATGVGGTLQVLNFIAFNDAWHPWQDPGWLYDAIQRRAIGDPGMYLHPDTGRYIDYRVETDVVTAGPDDTMAVPDTALFWNASQEAWVTVEDEFGGGVEAVSMVTTTLANPGKWHTGQDITMADVIYSIANAYRRCFGDIFAVDDNSCYADDFYLESIVKGYEFDIANNEVTLYIDFWHVDEQEIAASGFWYLGADDAPIPWEIAEAASQAALDGAVSIHEDTAEETGLPQLDLSRNPLTLSAVSEAFADIAAENRIPQGLEDIPGIGDVITAADATARYDASQAFFDQYGHWYASNGPFVMESINPAFRQTVMQAFRDGYPFKPDYWDEMKEVRVPTTTFGTFPSSLLAGAGATLDVSTSEGGVATDPQGVRWFVRQLGTGAIPLRGDAVRTQVGEFEVQLLSTLTVGLETGAYELVVIVTGDRGAVTQTFAFSVTSQLDFFQALFDTIEDRLETQQQQLTDLEDNVGLVGDQAGSLQTLVTAVLVLAIVAIVVPALMMVVILRRLPPGGT